MNFNREQYISVYSDQHLALTANAGSGKTFVLTQKYLHLLLNNQEIDLDPSKIVSITFTKKAASEMQAKIVRELDSRINSETDHYQLKRLKTARENLKYSRIQTINSFCNDIIEEFPDKTGFVANENELNETEIRTYLSKSVNDKIFEKSEEENENLKFILDNISLHKLQTILSKLINDNLYLTELKNVYSKSDNEIHQTSLERVISILNLHFNYFFEKTKYILSNADNRKLTDTQKTKLALAKKIFFDLEQLSKEENYSKFCDKFDEFERIKYGNAKFKSFFKNDIDKDLEESFDSILEVIKSLKNIDENKHLIKIGRLVFDWSLEIFEAYQNYKYDRQFIDFDDQLRYALSLLEDDYVLQNITKKIKYILIDEYQDTNQYQFEIVKKLISCNDIKLFIVGDQKQSIYGFRNSEIKLFNETSKLIENKNVNPFAASENKYLKEIELTKPERKGIVELPISYRMNRYLAAVLNNISKNLFDSDNEFSAKNTPIIVGRESENEQLKPYLEISLSEEMDDQVSEVINKIISLLNNGTKPEQIAILSRTNQQLLDLSKEFLLNNIPFELHSGINIIENQEIDDIICFLKVINGDKDNFQIVKLLRSYFFGLSDEEILNLYSKNYNIFDSLKFSEKHKEISDIISQASELKDKYTAIELVQYIIRKTKWQNITSQLKNKENIIDNVDQFILILDDLSSQRIISISDILNKFEKDKSDNASYKRNISLAEDKINMLTIHSSKGLEFDCVILFDSMKSSRNNSTYFISKEFGLAFDLSDEQNNNYAVPIKYITKKQEKLAELEESKRLFYVAISRAKEKLILTANIKNAIKKDNIKVIENSFLDFFLNGLNLDINNLDYSSSIINNESRINKYNNDNSLSELNINYQLVFSNYTEENELIKDKNSEEVLVLDDLLLDPISLETLTATKLNYLKNDKLLFRERYMYGMPESDKSQFKGIYHSAENEKDEILGTKKGIIVHAVLENIPLFFNKDKLDQELVLKCIKDVLKNENSFEENIESTIQETVFGVLESPFIQKHIPVLKNVKTEVSLEMPFENNFLKGLIDLYLIDDKGNYEIWDWKTNNIRKEEIQEKAEFYKPQMLFYSYLLHFFKPDQEIFKAKLFFTKFASIDCKEKDWIYEFNFTKDDLNKFENDLKLNFSILKELHFA